MKLRLLIEAEAEIEAVRQYLNCEARGMGSRFVDDLELTFTQILERPAIFPKLETLPAEEPYRRALLQTFR